MRSTFGAYYRPNAAEFEELWSKCVFILDANVLLGLHRYPKEAYDDLIRVLTQISDRLWIPHQVAIEYQQGRLDVIADQVSKYGKVRNILTGTKDQLMADLDALQLKKRHSVIDPSRFLSRVQAAFTAFTEELETLRKNQPEVSDQDNVRDQIDSLLHGRVGQPLSGGDLDKLYTEGKQRYEQKRPPGYLDRDKSKSDNPYFYNDLILKREYGDLIIWYQIIAEASARQLKHIVLVTDDDKEDWWWRHSGKTIGPRPELVEEIRGRAGVSLFYMYSSARFLEFAEQYLGVKVKGESIDQVREISQLRRMYPALGAGPGAEYYRAEEAVLSWLTILYPDSEIVVTERFPDFVVTHKDGTRMGFEVKHFYGPRIAFNRVSDALYRGYYVVSQGELRSLTLVLVMGDERNVLDAQRWLKDLSLPDNVHVLVGVITPDDQSAGTPTFRPIVEK